MQQHIKTINRRKFLQTTAVTALVTGAAGFLPLYSLADPDPDPNLNLIGPVPGYSPHIGIMVSMMNWMRATVLRAVEGLKPTELDVLIDPKANTIGALLLHLAATDVVYQDMTFYNLKGFSEENKKKWGVAMSLGEDARMQIKGNNLDFYLSALQEVREKTLAEFKKRDDKWFARVDTPPAGRLPRNNFCKWFHVCEHEANHRGQITMIKKRLPGFGDQID